MCSSVWFLIVIALFVVDVRIEASLQKEQMPVHQCYQCSEPTNSSQTHTSCNTPLKATDCPQNLHHCVTTLSSAGYSQSLGCAEATEESCALLFIPSDSIYRLTCVCANILCNQPFSSQLVPELREFFSHSPHNATNTTDVTDLFLNYSSLYRNSSKNNLFNKFTNITADSNLNTNLNKSLKESNAIELTKNITRPANILAHNAVLNSTIKNEVIVVGPKAEALKDEVRVLSDDDEDDGEGSGTWEEAKSHRRPAPAAAAPSAYQPAFHENRASSVLLNNLISVTIFLLVVI